MVYLKFLCSFFFYLLSSLIIYSQGSLNIHVKDSTGNPIQYASVIWGRNNGLVTNANGYLQIPDKTKIDSLIISAIGYHNKIIKDERLFKNSTIDIVLQQSVYQLPEITIANYEKEEELGCINTNKQTSYFKNLICGNLQAAFLINSYNYPALCKSISVFIAKQSSNNIPFRLRLYEINKDNLPGKDLISKNMTVLSYKTNSWNTYDLDSIPVQLPPNGFFVAVEWLCTDVKSENGLSIGLFNRMKMPLTFYKYGNVGWVQLKYKNSISKDNIMLKVRIVSTK